MRSRAGRTRFVSVLVTGILLVGALTGSAAAVSGPSERTQAHTVGALDGQSAASVSNDTSAFVVALSSNGSARVTLRLTYDLTEDAERTGFERLKANASTFAESYATRLEPLAARASNETGREMAIRDPTAQFTNAGKTGIVELSVTWTNVAAHRDGRVVLAEPFSNGFEPDRPFVVRGPDGYELTSAAPNPEAQSSRVAAWNASEPLDGLSVAFETADATDEQPAETTTSSTEMPVGPAPVVALFGVVAALGLFVRRRD